jgi:hypothetical protein
MSEYQLNKSGAIALGYRPQAYNSKLSMAAVTAKIHRQGIYKQP